MCVQLAIYSEQYICGKETTMERSISSDNLSTCSSTSRYSRDIISLLNVWVNVDFRLIIELGSRTM